MKPPRNIVGPLGFRVPGSLVEISSLSTWLADTATRSYVDGEEAVFEYGRSAQLQYRSPPYCHLIWPPDPNQLMLRIFLRMLGWTLTVEARGEMVIARLNLGTTRVWKG